MSNTLVQIGVCEDNHNYEDLITVGKIYFVTISNLPNGKRLLDLYDDNGVRTGMTVSKFKLC